MQQRQTRRAFLSRMGRGTVAVAVFGVGLAGCDDDGGELLRPRLPDATSGDDATATTQGGGTVTTVRAGEAVTWERVSLGFVSAYVLVRSGEAAVVDTGVAGSADEIEVALASLGLDWGAVGHVILTHSHGDHAGSVADVLTLATAATGYAGGNDIPDIASPRPLVAVEDGDTVFGLRIVATPGHTPGHVSVFDAPGRLLVAGDALNGTDAMGGEPGGVAGANPEFTADLVTADASVLKLAELDIDTIVFGHGEPVVGGAGEELAQLADSI